MLILISHPEKFKNEAEIVNYILDEHHGVIFHLRKPGFAGQEAEQLISSVKPEFHSRIVIHQHFSLAEAYPLKGIHLKEADRNKDLNSAAKIISTSFHRLNDALKFGGRFEYFFCSPVFQSISKPDYKSLEEWAITSQPDEFREKAVALGGIDPHRSVSVSKKGFKNVAVLGAVWNSGDPVRAFSEIVQAFDV